MEDYEVNKESFLSKLRIQYEQGLSDRLYTMDDSLEDIILQYEICKKKAQESKNKSLVAPYKHIAKSLINEIPGLQETEEINNMIERQSKKFSDNLDNINYPDNLEQEDKYELMMLGFLSMSGVMSLILKKKKEEK